MPAVEDFLTSFLAHLRYGSKPSKGQLSASRRLASASLEALHRLPDTPVVKTRKRTQRRTR